jgi:hypothetical protein
MLRELLKGGEWSDLLDLVSPSFFDVLRPRDLQREVRRLTTNYVRRRAFDQARQRLQRQLRDASVPIQLGVEIATDTPTTDPQRRGQWVLELFFRQLLHADEALLDLRFDRFGERDAELMWNPRPLVAQWDTDFIDTLRKLYAGYYEDDPPSFRDALGRLGLRCAEEVFAAQFARGRQESVAFRLSDFRRTFHDTFVQCRDCGATLHGGFVPFGIYLAFLYEHLERLGGEHDVIRAFRASRSA